MHEITQLQNFQFDVKDIGQCCHVALKWFMKYADESDLKGKI